MKSKADPNHMEIEISNPLEQIFDVTQISELTGIHPDLVIEFEHAGLVYRQSTDRGGHPRFDVHALCRYQQIAELRTAKN